MGDADIPQIMMPVQELEEIMEEALNEVDDEMSRLFTFVTFLNDRTTNIMREVVSWQKIHSCFIALNVFVIPVILAINIAFVAIDLVEMNSYPQYCLQTFMMFLMCLSGSIGLPVYFFTLWQAYFTTNKMEKICIRREHSVISLEQNDMDSNAASSRPPTMAEIEESFDTISEFRRLVGRQIRGNRIAELERRINRGEEAARVSSQESDMVNYGVRQMTETQNGNAVTVTSQQLIDTGFNTVPRKEEMIFEKEEDIGSVKIIVNDDWDFSVEMEKEEETSESVRNNSNSVTDQIKFSDSTGISAVPSVEKFREGNSKDLKK